jgi:hypothetical protein
MLKNERGHRSDGDRLEQGMGSNEYFEHLGIEEVGQELKEYGFMKDWKTLCFSNQVI